MASLKNDLIETLKSTEVQEVLVDTVDKPLDVRVDQMFEKIAECKLVIKSEPAEIADLNRKLEIKDNDIDELRQSSRRNNMRVFGISQTQDENTDELIINLAKTLDVNSH